MTAQTAPNGPDVNCPRPLTPADLRHLRAAARPGGLRVRLRTRHGADGLERLDRLNQRRFLTYGGLIADEQGLPVVMYGLSEAGRRLFELH